jgi:hypothetical protein
MVFILANLERFAAHGYVIRLHDDRWTGDLGQVVRRATMDLWSNRGRGRD